MSFWRPLQDSSVVKELPPLTPQAIDAREHQLGIKFPPALLELLRTKNGGFLQNPDFRLEGEAFGVREIFGIGDGKGFREIRPASSFLVSEDPEPNELGERIRQQAGDLERLLVFADNDFCWYALDYNHLNSAGEPPVIWALTDEEDAAARRVADSVADFLHGQYFGEVEPSVHMEEAQRYTVLTEGGYEGTHRITGKAIQIAWKICADGDRLILFQREDWGQGEMRARAEICRTALGWEPIPLEEYGVDLEPGLAKLIRGTVEAKCLEVTRHDVPVSPGCYELGFRLPPSEETRIKLTRSEAYQGRWKNSSSDVLATQIYGSDKAVLRKAIDLIVGKPKRSKGFFGKWFGRR
jgi:hypothetical protein